MNKNELLDISDKLLSNIYKSRLADVNEWVPRNFYAKMEPDVGLYSSFIRGDYVSSWGAQSYGGYRLDFFNKDSQLRSLTLQGYEAILGAAEFLNLNAGDKNSLVEKIIHLDNFTIDFSFLPLSATPSSIYKYYAFQGNGTIFALLRSDGEMFSYADYFEVVPIFKEVANLEALKRDFLASSTLKSTNKAVVEEVTTILEKKITMMKEKSMLEKALPEKLSLAPSSYKV